MAENHTFDWSDVAPCGDDDLRNIRAVVEQQNGDWNWRWVARLVATIDRLRAATGGETP